MLKTYETEDMLRQPKPLDEIKQAVKDGALNTSTHGVPNLARADNPFLRLMWIVCVAGAIGGCCYTNTKNILNYLKFDVVSNTQVIREFNVKFPTFTFCNVNPLITQAAIDYSKKKFAALKREVRRGNKSVEMLVEDFDQIRYMITASSLQPNVSQQTRDSFNLPLNNIIISCMFNWGPCDYTDFEPYFDQLYGGCFKFNSGKNYTHDEIDDKLVFKSGKASGLKLELYLPEPTNYYSFPTSLGCHVFLNNKSVAISYYEGFDLPIGAQSNVAISRVFTRRQHTPFNECVRQDNLSERSTLTKIFADNNLQYRRTDCFHYCYQRRLVEVCGCWDLDYPLSTFGDTQPCVTYADFNCTFEFYNVFFAGEVIQNCTQDCPEECDSISYRVTVTSSLYPTEIYASARLYNKTSLNKILTNLTSAEKYDKLKMNTLAINVFYDDLSYTLYEESPKTELVLYSM